MSKITAIEPGKKDPTRLAIYLDGTFAFDLSAIVAAWLKPGQELDEFRIASLQADDLRERAFQLALQTLSYRTRSESEIRQYLARHKVPADVVNQTLERLRVTHLADDAQFARTWVENRTTFRPRSRRALSWELWRKGVASPASEAALAGLDEDALAYAAGQKKAARWTHLDWNTFRTKLSGFLARRGFPYPVISGAVARLWNETHPGQPTADSNEDTQ